MCSFKDIYDKSLAVEVAVSEVLNKYDCKFHGTYILEYYKNPTSNEEANEEPNASPLSPKEPDSHIEEVIIKHDKQLASSSQPTNTITNVFNQIQLIASFDQGGHAYNTFYIVDDGTCRVYIFNLYFETKGQATSTQEIGRIPDVILPTDGKSKGFPASFKIMAPGIFNKLKKKLVLIEGKGVSWMNEKIVKPIMPITNALLQSLGPAGSMVAKGISAGSSAVDALFGPNKQQSKQQFRQDFKTLRQDDLERQKVPIDVISKRLQLLGNEFQ
ncbi:MAG: hypothetical protein EZS28_014008 [Streblomastix strix]|uniref:Uncharacterized protein n=1 Tax=Streblomastix strix TaxID=222440 RepID=A0A5J4W6I1_9EUKA|nr:MAG: hypothetical protein EZS28_014008 [Streblomastix strix]